MKKIVQKFAAIITMFMMGVGMLAPAIQATPAYAAGPTTSFGAEGAAILTNCYDEGKDSKNGQGIKCVIMLVVNILSVLIGIVGVIGIVWVGIQYLTAGGDEAKTRKAKRRLFEIIIGLAAYAAGYALLSWLLPNFGA